MALPLMEQNQPVYSILDNRYSPLPPRKQFIQYSKRSQINWHHKLYFITNKKNFF